MKAIVYNFEGKKVGEVELDSQVFGLSRNIRLIHQVYASHTSNRRQVLAKTKTRGERAGSGKKPWAQKGTGRARVGSVRSPLWKKGGVIFGPTNERSFKKKINRKMNAKAITGVLSGKYADKEFIVLDGLNLSEKKTKKISEGIKNLKIGDGKILMSFSESEKDMSRYSRNISRVKNILTSQLNVFDMLNTKYLVLSRESVKYLETKYKK